MLGSQGKPERGTILLSLKMTSEVGPRAFYQAPEPAGRLPADPCRFAEREADRLDQDQRFALLGPKPMAMWNKSRALVSSSKTPRCLPPRRSSWR